MYLSQLNKFYCLLLAYLLLNFIQPNLGQSNQELSAAILQYLESHRIPPNDRGIPLQDLSDPHISYIFDEIAQMDTDPEFSSYIEKYNALKIQKTGQPINPNVKVVFSRSPFSMADYNYFDTTAYCDPLSHTIFIDRGFWNHRPEIFREMLIFHELGHCDLNQGHTKDFSIMNNSYTFNALFIPELLPNPNHSTDSDEEIAIIMNNYQNRFNSNLQRAFEVLKEELFPETNNESAFIFSSLGLGFDFLEIGALTFEQRLTRNNWMQDNILSSLEASDQEIRTSIRQFRTEALDNMIYALQQGRNSQNTQRIDEVIAIIREVQENR